MSLLITISVLYAVCFFMLAILILYSGYSIKQRDFRVMLIFLVLSFSIIAFATYPSAGTDLSRYYIELNIMRNLGKEYAFGESLYNTTPLANLLFYIISCTSIDNLLPCISTFIVFALLFKNMMKIKDKFSIHVKYILFYLFLFIAVCSLRAMMTGVRQGLACSIMAVAVSRELLFDKKGIVTWGLYLSAVLVHIGIFPIVLIRILSSLIKKCRFLVILWGLLIPVMDFLASSTNEFIKMAYEKMLGYSEIDYPDMRLLMAKTAVFIILMIFIFHMKYKNQTDINKKFMNFYEVLVFFTIGSYSIPHLYERMITFSMFISLPIVYVGLKTFEKKSREVYYIILLFIIVGLLLYWLVDLRTSWVLTTEIFN